MNWLKELESGDIVYLRQENINTIELSPAEIISTLGSSGFEFGVIAVQGIGEFKYCSLGMILEDDYRATGDRIVPALASTRYGDIPLIIPKSESLEAHHSWLNLLLLKKGSQRIEEFAKSNGIDELDAFWFFKGNPVESEAFKKICLVLKVDCDQVQKDLFPKFKVGDLVVVPSNEPIYEWDKFVVGGKILKNNIWFYWESEGGVQFPEHELFNIGEWRLNLQDFASTQTNLIVLAMLATKYGCYIDPDKIQQMREFVINDDQGDDRAIAAEFLAFNKNRLNQPTVD